MSSKKSEMYTETSIQDLPDEMLGQILLFLNGDDRRSALRVCRRWSTLIPLSSVKLLVDFDRDRGQEANYHRTLLASSRQYKHLVFRFGSDSDKYELLVDILQHFSHKVETLKLIPCCSVPIEQMLIRQILSLCANLRHLHIATCIIDYGPHNLKHSPMHKLDELYMGDGVLSLIPNMMNITPNITRLHMLSLNSEESLIFLRHFSLQLVDLKIEILSMDYFPVVCEMRFPLLEKLDFFCLDFEIDPDGSFNEVAMIDQFFHELPLLKEVTLRGMLDDRVVQNLCRSCVNIQFLCVKMHSILQDCFRAICELKHLKHLRIDYATVKVPPDMCSRQTSLQKLTLNRTLIVDHAKFNSFVQRVFPNLAVMELLDLVVVNGTNERRLLELYEQICSNIPSLQRLVVRESGQVMLGRLLEFCASHAPKELRFRCSNILDIPKNETPKRIPVQKLFLDLHQISFSVLKKIISSLEELRRLEITLTEYCSPEEIRSLRKQIPRCCIVTNPSITHISNYQKSDVCNEKICYKKIENSISTKCAT